MTGLFGTLNTSTSGLRAQQLGLQTTGHNLANVNTKGYSRQRVNTSANLPQNFAGIGQVGTGVVIDNITRITDEFVNAQLQDEEASLERFQEVSDILAQLETMFNEPSDSGISQQLNELFAAWDEVAANPESETAKSLVISQAETFLDTINHTANNMEKLDGEIIKQIDKEVLDFNSRIEQLDALNKQIFNATVKGEHPNDLLDRRDMLVSDLKHIAGVEEKIDGYGRAFIKLDGKDVLTSSESFELSMEKFDDGFKFSITDSDGNSVHDDVSIESGRIKGKQEGFATVQDKKAELNNFVNKYVTAVNLIYSGVDDVADLDNVDPKDLFFVLPDDINEIANKVKVNQSLIDAPGTLIVAGDLDKNHIGDGDRAKAMSGIKDALLTGDKADWDYDPDAMTITLKDGVTGGSKMNDTFTAIVTDLGVKKQKADSMVENQLDLAALLAQRQASVSGVDMNEEVTNMIQFSSAFQANARAISTISEMLDTLINRMGV